MRCTSSCVAPDPAGQGFTLTVNLKKDNGCVNPLSYSCPVVVYSFLLPLRNRRRWEAPWRNQKSRASRAIARSGEVLDLVRRGSLSTTAEIATHMRVARSTVAERIDLLTHAGLLVSEGARVVGRGRPARHLRFNPGAGLILVAQLGLSGSRVGVTDLAGTVLTSRTIDLDLSVGTRVGPPADRGGMASGAQASRGGGQKSSVSASAYPGPSNSRVSPGASSTTRGPIDRSPRDCVRLGLYRCSLTRMSTSWRSLSIGRTT